MDGLTQDKKSVTLSTQRSNGEPSSSKQNSHGSGEIRTGSIEDAASLSNAACNPIKAVCEKLAKGAPAEPQKAPTKASDRTKVSTVHDLITIAYKENGVLSGKAATRIPMGITLLEPLIGGMSPGMLCVLGALPNVGKSTAIIDWAMSVSESRHTAGIISLEDSPQLFGERLQSMYSSVSAQDIRDAGHTYSGTGMSERVLQASVHARLLFAFPPRRTLDETLDAIRDLVARGAEIIYIDYFSAIENTDNRSPRAGYNQMLISMKALGAKLGVPIVLAAQIARMPTKYDHKTNKVVEVEPDYNNLGETSFLERMAEIVILMWKNQEGDTFGRLAKNKYGRARLPKFNIWQDGKTGRLTYKEVTGKTLE